MEPTRTILIVEDDDAVRRGIADALSWAGYGVVEASDGDTGLASALRIDPDLVLLDVVLPGRDGFQVLTEIRDARPAMPVIMLTARGAVEDRVRGLEGGADDYVVKPFNATELLARVKAVTRRSAERPRSVGELTLPGRRIDFERREVRFEDGTVHELSVREAELLHYLAQHRGRPVPRDELLSRVWGLDPRGLRTRTVDMHVARLRSRLGDDEPPRFVITVRSRGYLLAAADDLGESGT